MRTIYFGICMFWIMVGCAPYIKDGNFKERKLEGYVFPKEQEVSYVTFENMNMRFTPTQEEVMKAEDLLKDQLGKLNQAQINQGKECPIIHKKLSRYKRQYVGYITNEGEKIIWINFIWEKHKGLSDGLSQGVIVVLDGCSYYWNIKANLKEERVYDLFVNASA